MKISLRNQINQFNKEMENLNQSLNQLKKHPKILKLEEMHVKLRPNYQLTF
jgi:hypothetical protein